MQRFLKAAAALGILSVGALAHAGATGGPREDCDVIDAYQIITYTTTFVEGEAAKVRVRSFGKSYLAVVVYDEVGNEIVGAIEKPGEDIVLTWYPRWTGRFRVKIANPASVSNIFYFSHN
jgi:hypothetical protein